MFTGFDIFILVLLFAYVISCTVLTVMEVYRK